jgi:hypothetical protein
MDDLCLATTALNLGTDDINTTKSLLDMKKKSRMSWIRAWTRLVQNYSERQLTKPEDKLPALSGLVETISRLSDDCYMAGHWLETVIETLAWRVYVYEPDHFCGDPSHDALLPPPKKSTVKSAPEYRAPSWSWAALDAHVEFPYTRIENPIAEVIDWHIESSSRKKLVPLQDGYVTILVRYLR